MLDVTNQVLSWYEVRNASRKLVEPVVTRFLLAHIVNWPAIFECELEVSGISIMARYLGV